MKTLVLLVIVVAFGFFIFRLPYFQNSTLLSLIPSASDSTPSTTSCTGVTTPFQTEGPYFKSGSPEKNFIAENVSGEKLIVAGHVFDTNCKPIPRARLDFWQADSGGVYDNRGFTLRGHQFTDNEGKYRLETIIPAAYESRPPHIHVKVTPPNDPTLTSQLYFPDETLNQNDSIFNPLLMMKISNTLVGKQGVFDFIINQ